MNFQQINRLVNTIKFLKYTQISTRIFYLLRNKFRRILGQYTYTYSIISLLSLTGRWEREFTYSKIESQSLHSILKKIFAQGRS